MLINACDLLARNRTNIWQSTEIIDASCSLYFEFLPPSIQVVYTRFLRWGRGPGSNGGYFFTLEKSKFSRFFKLEDFQNLIKSMKNLYFFKFLRKFCENLGKSEKIMEILEQDEN